MKMTWSLSTLSCLAASCDQKLLPSMSLYTFWVKVHVQAHFLYLSIVWIDCTLLLLILALSGILLLTWHMQLSKQFILLLVWVLTVSHWDPGEWENEWGANIESGDRARSEREEGWVVTRRQQDPDSHCCTRDSFRNYFYKYFIYVDILVLEVYPNPTINNSQTNVTFVFF